MEKVDQPAPTAEDAAGLLQLLKATRDVITTLQSNRALFEELGDQPLDRETREALMPLWAAMIDLDLAYASYRSTFLEHWRQAPGEEGQVDYGDLVLLVGFGGGMTAASCVLRWGGDAR